MTHQKTSDFLSDMIDSLRLWTDARGARPAEDGEELRDLLLTCSNIVGHNQHPDAAFHCTVEQAEDDDIGHPGVQLGYARALWALAVAGERAGAETAAGTISEQKLRYLTAERWLYGKRDQLAALAVRCQAFYQSDDDAQENNSVFPSAQTWRFAA